MKFSDWIKQIAAWVLFLMVWIFCFLFLSIFLVFKHLLGYFYDLCKESKQSFHILDDDPSDMYDPE